KISHWEDWYEVTKRQIGEKGGWGLLTRYNNSPSSLITSVFPWYPWQLWRFCGVPDGYWEDRDHLCRYFEELSHILGKNIYSMWEHTSHHSLLPYKGHSIFGLYGSLARCLKEAYPEIRWNFSSTSIGQSFLLECVRELFGP